ncbi:hypothetical protein BD410DRAFT_784255 [Rickenella mellea]|uniref:Chitin-binding type-3 domain-containing protein n=1 Tax=Rickenella mellea TaxID=50990 RepID=A0A4Y7QG17_9AGAM|nr:hypothetical protein BD410DRAFT_784255 [Rickenella mellea]
MGYRGTWDGNFVHYNPGDVVEYAGTNGVANYRIIQPHDSEPGWNPEVTPALWEKLSNPPQGYQHHQQGGNCDPTPPQCEPGHGRDPTSHSGYTTDTGVHVKPEEAKRPWYDLDDDKKKKLLEGGGLAIGLAALGAGGYYYEHQKHKKEGEQETEQAWALQNWIKEAQNRTAAFFRDGPQEPATWLWSESLGQNPDVRQYVFQAGHKRENGRDTPLFIARAFHHGSLQIGKADFESGATIGYSHDAIRVNQFEVLVVTNPQAVHWVPTSGYLDFSALQGARPVPGGHEADNTPLFIAHILYEGNVIPGKASPKLKHAFFTYNNEEKESKEYKVLCYA